MSNRSARMFVLYCGLCSAVAMAEGPALAQTAGNPQVQNFFTAACAGATGALAARCAQTNGTNISTDSESSLNPNQTAVVASAMLSSARALAAETEKRLEGLRDEESGKAGTSTGKIAGFEPWSVFVNLEGEWFDQSRPAFANERGFDGESYQGTLGVSYRASPASQVGLMLGYKDYSAKFDPDRAGNQFVPQADAGGLASKQIIVAAFANFALGASAWLDASAGLAFSDNDFRRNAQFQESTRTVAQTNVSTKGSANGREYFASVGLGYDFVNGPLSIGPYVRTRYVRSRIDAYSEQDLSGSGLALNVSQSRATSLTGSIGARGSYAISTGWGVIVPQARLEFEHEFDDDPRATLTSFVLDPARNQLAVLNDAPDRDHFNGGLSVVFILPNGVMPFIDYEALIGYSDFSRHRVTAGLRLEF